MWSDKIKQLIINSLLTLGLPSADFSVEHPKEVAHGDYASNVALVLFPQLKEQGITTYPNPHALAQAITNKLIATSPPDLIASISVAGPGFINFTLSQTVYLNELSRILDQQADYGKSDINRGKRVIVEYSSPNIAKPFTIGHLRSTIIGAAIANLKAATGWEVYRDNHLGDWGTQFGKLICAIKKNWIPLDAIEASERPVKLLVDLYVKFHQEAEVDPALEDEGRSWFKKLEAHDPEATFIWKKCIDWSWKEFSRIYDLLQVAFSPEFNEGRGLGESFFEDKMAAVIQELTDKQFLQPGENGAQLVFYPDDQYPPLMILKQDGATLYATRDLATDKYRQENYRPDLIINEVGTEQSLYFKQLFDLEYRLGWYQPGQRIHIGHGLYRFAEGKMSTRKGNVVWLETVIDEAIQRATALAQGQLSATAGAQQHHLTETELEDVAAIVGIGALKWNDLKGEAKRDIIFDWDEVLSMKGNSGPYIQYTYVRCKSVLEKVPSPLSLPASNPTLNSEELAIVQWLYKYPEVIADAAANNAPHLVSTYTFELAQRFNTFYNQHSILGNPAHPLDEITKSLRYTLTLATQQILKNALTILGIETPDKM